jgi:hypothetical protein
VAAAVEMAAVEMEAVGQLWRGEEIWEVSSRRPD